MGVRPTVVALVLVALLGWLYASLPRAEEGPGTLVVYVATAREPGSLENVRYFLRHAAGAGPGGVPDGSADYVVVADARSFDAVVAAAPRPVPPNIRFERTEETCHTAGAVGGALRRMRDAKALAAGRHGGGGGGGGGAPARAPEDYRFVVWLDSTIRGPFLPVYLRRRGGARERRKPAKSAREGAGWGGWAAGARPAGRADLQLAASDVGGAVGAEAAAGAASGNATSAAGAGGAASPPPSPASTLPSAPPPRVPVLPFSLEDPPAWHELLTSLLSEDVKLVGSTISCRSLRTSFSGASTSIPHVQGSLRATDREGLRILEAVPPERAPFGCHASLADAVRWGEIGPSEAVFARGKTIGSLMLRYDGVDFRDPSANRCNGGISPLGAKAYDGGDLHPLEAMFVKSSEALQAAGNPSAVQADRIAGWDDAREAALEGAARKELERTKQGNRGRKDVDDGEDKAKGDAEGVSAAERRAYAAVAARLPLRVPRPDVESNAFGLEAPALLEALEAKGRDCFDAAFYLASEPFEFGGFGPKQAWEHFVNYGFREGRPYRFVC